MPVSKWLFRKTALSSEKHGNNNKPVTQQRDMVRQDLNNVRFDVFIAEKIHVFCVKTLHSVETGN